MNQPRLSVVVPSYNSVDFIDETMRSILGQTGVDAEVIVADHGSTDGTWERLQEYAADDRVTLHRTEAGGGAERNFNAVSRLARGQYIKLVCGDDILYPDVLRRQVELLDAHPRAIMTASFRDLVDAGGRPVLRRWGLRKLDRASTGASAIRRAVRAGSNLFGEPACVMMRRDELEQVGFWNFDTPYLVDLATYARLLFRGDFVPDRQVGAAFRLNAGQWSVALARTQSRQVRAFHSWARRNHPEAISESDRRLGDLRARAMQWKRRLTYLVLNSRMAGRPRVKEGASR